MAEQSEQLKQWTKIVAKAWADEEFKQRLLSAPSVVLREEGLEVADDITITVVQETEAPTWLTLPLPQEDQLSAEESEERRAAFLC